MILELIFDGLFGAVHFIASLLPSLPARSYDSSGLGSALAFGISILPSGFFPIFVSNVIFYKTAQMAWAIVEWLYKKIPGVD